MKSIKDALHSLQKELREDPSYYHAWQANIAMSFYDEYKRKKKKYINRKDLHEISNKAAENFLYILCLNIDYELTEINKKLR